MKLKNNRIALVVLASSISLASLPASAFAQNSSNAEVNRIQEKKATVHKQTQEAKNEIAKLENQQRALLNSLDTLEATIKEAKNKTVKKEDEINQGKKNIERLEKELNELKIRMDQRQEILNERMRSLQKSGGNVTYLDVILGSASFNDLIQRISAVGTFMKADKEIINEQQNDLNSVKEKKNKLGETQTVLEKDKVKLVTLSNTLIKQENEMKKLLNEMKDQVHEKEQNVLNLEEQEELLTQQEKAMKAARSGTRKTFSNVANSSGLPTVSSGNFTRPADGFLSSGFGYRKFDNEMHWGLDIVKKGNVPIVSTADGVVIRAYQSSSYGNVVYITHNIDGKTFTSVYAHMTKFIVSTGQTVTKGQQIGIMGNTGQSFGQHLHFELHAGQWNQAKSNAVDPAKYINM
ncbi:murein hydrolase activator EnvC family protein [Gottfriedia acidiceleris]|uniref:Peptidoglycan DD-metalloendopeptidase family protein n=1 Tax=Gottfriedia acidiceleris TaxID=371036 RepID=A0ABY4JQK1_9BACI|nr:M23 family metallopeptidase [Gottfriedia acidiceleris]UPM56115.1 peptidoglycan DD-metalloendopeptidase family protein [Gottfriedia acidiceleris]